MLEGTLDESLVIKAESALDLGLDFLVRHQCTDTLLADHGRFPHEYDIAETKIVSYSVNWTTALAVDTLMIAYRFKKVTAYFEAAKKGLEYLKTLQVFPPFHDNYGMIVEETPQSNMCYPRDALTAALCFLNWYRETGDTEMFARAKLFADWFIRVAMRDNYPHWSVELNSSKIDPAWFGSFHSGSAYFFIQLYAATKEDKYLTAARVILDHYNKYHLNESGHITVIKDRQTFRTLQGEQVSHHVPSHWELMHIYNDDFGALANLAAYAVMRDEVYVESAKTFLKCMIAQQMPNGAFGNKQEHVPSASGVIVMELLAAREIGMNWCRDNTIDSAINFILELQYRKELSPANGIFRESPKGDGVANLRTISYSLMALLRYAGAKDSTYFFK